MFKKKQLASAILAATAATSATVAAQSTQREIEEVLVTATKRTASTQDIPIAVSVVNEQSMDELGIANFEDYLLQLPGVTAGVGGPGQDTIYIRGVASTTPHLTVSGVAGLAPNVGLYLDEQPLSQPGRNLDVYTADMNRVEVLSGPQGTLFGASSQAGTVRLITNKPDPAGTYGSIDLGSSWLDDGEMSNNIEGMFNVTVSDRLTLRGVGFVDSQGGYIDNIRGNTQTARESARFRGAGTLRANGVPVSEARAGNLAGSDFSAVTFMPADNAALVDDDINGTTYTGGRLSARYEFNDEWTLSASHTRQQLESDGTFYSDPNLDDYEIQRYVDESIEDEFDNTSWTLEGRIGELEALYTGAYTDRATDQIVDYSDYLFVGQYLPYYICDSSVVYPAAGENPAGICYSPHMFIDSRVELEVETHEVRFATDENRSVRATFGGFYSDLELTELNDFTYPSALLVNDGAGWPDNFPYMSGYFSDPGPFPADAPFRNDIRRTDEQYGVFGELYWDFAEQWSLTLGARYYDIEVDFEGSANTSVCNLIDNMDENTFGTDISDLYDGDGQVTFRNTCTRELRIPYTRDTVGDSDLSPQDRDYILAAVDAPDTAQTDGVIGKVSLSYAPADNTLFYLTWSEGFRPGLLNRPGGRTNGAGTFTVPFELDTDDVTNIEFGWKADLLDNTLRFNGSIFSIDVQNLQTTIFDPNIVNLFFSDNAADAEVRGIEGDFIWQPATVDGLTLTGAFSLLDTEIIKVITPTDDVRDGDELAFAPGFQANLRARYEWSLDSGLTAHVMPNIAYSAESYSDIISINRVKIDSWAMAGLTAGVSSDDWTAEFFVDNLTSEAAEISRNFVYDRERVIYARPRTMGVRFSYNF